LAARSVEYRGSPDFPTPILDALSAWPGMTHKLGAERHVRAFLHIPSAEFMHSRRALLGFPHFVAARLYENLLIHFMSLITGTFSSWLKNGHFNNSTAK
jgi:hypothetical protein